MQPYAQPRPHRSLARLLMSAVTALPLGAGLAAAGATAANAVAIGVSAQVGSSAARLTYPGDAADLAYTGSTLPIIALAIGAVAVAVGAAMVLVRAHRRDKE